MHKCFRDRVEAGQLLASRLERYARRDDVIVLALPRGGVPVAFEIACRLHVPLDVLVVRKLGVPGHEELAMGAIGPGGVEVLEAPTVAAFHVPPDEVAQVARRERAELDRRERLYRDARPFPNLKERIVILVDDGIATGCTMRAAIAAAREHGARAIVVAIPVASVDAVQTLRAKVDDVVAVLTPYEIFAVGQFYGDFQPTSDDEVKSLLIRAAVRAGSGVSVCGSNPTSFPQHRS